MYIHSIEDNIIEGRAMKEELKKLSNAYDNMIQLRSQADKDNGTGTGRLSVEALTNKASFLEEKNKKLEEHLNILQLEKMSLEQTNQELVKNDVPRSDFRRRRVSVTSTSSKPVATGRSSLVSLKVESEEVS
jgi:hypothetical protein